MANYNVDIAVAVSNLNALQRFKRELISLQRAVEDFNSKKLEKGSKAEEQAVLKLARKKRDLNTKIAQNLANANLKSLEELTKKELELEDKVFKDKLQSIKDLQKAEEKASRELKRDEEREFRNKLDARKRFDRKTEASLKMAFKGIEGVSKGAQKLDDITTKMEMENDDIVFKAKLAKYEQETKVIMQDIRRRNRFELKEHDEKLREQVRATRRANRQAERETSGAGTGAVGRGRKRGGRLNAALTAGAFPLLFGGGAGTALGGALGGAITGQLFGGLTVVGQVLGGAIDGFVAKTSQLGQALNPLTADFEALIVAAGGVNSNTSLLIKELESADQSAAALALATKELSIQVGDDGIEALTQFGSDTVELGNEFNKAMSIMSAGVAGVINSVGILKVAVGVLERVVLRQQINKLINTDTPEGRRLKASTTQVFSGSAAAGSSQMMFTEDTFNIMREINEQASGRVNQAARRLLVDKDANKIAKAELTLQETGLDFANERFVSEKKRIALMRYNDGFEKAALDFANDAGDQQLAKQRFQTTVEKLQLDLRKERFEIDQKAAKAIEAQTKKEEAANKKISDAAKKTADERARQVDQAMTLEREFTLELANRQSVSQLETDRNNIHAEYEQRMERLRKIGDKTLTADAERLAGQIKTSKLAEAEANARERSLRAANSLKDSQAGFEMQLATLQANAPGQFGGVFGGSQRTAFLGGLEMDFELQKRNREIGLMQGKVAAGTAQQSEVENLIAARDQYKLYQEQILEATVAQQQFAEALAVTRPVTDSLFDGLMAVAEGTKTAEQAFADFLRSIASMLVDVAKQMIAQYIAIGIARMFAGIPAPQSSGSPASKYGTVPSLAPSLGGGTLSDPKGLFTPPTLISGRALGGAVGAGRPYMVGERGPELFVPGAQGNIVPNNAMGGANVTVNVDASGSSVEGNADQASQLGKAIGIAVQQELVKQKRPGGLLAS